MVGIERKLGPKGQIVIPEEIRKAKGLKPGMTVVVDVEDSKIVVEPKKMGIVEWLEEQVKKDGKVLGKIDWDKSYEEEFEAKWGAKGAISRR